MRDTKKVIVEIAVDEKCCGDCRFLLRPGICGLFYFDNLSPDSTHSDYLRCWECMDAEEVKVV